MNKNDFKLIIIVIIVVVILFSIYLISNQKTSKALVYFDNEIILTIDLNVDKFYTVKGELGDVLIEVKNNKIRVVEENSQYHLCSKQGFVSKSNESIICLPNKIIIELPKEDNIDTEIR